MNKVIYNNFVRKEKRMKKIASIITTAALVLTSVFVFGAFSSSAETATDNASLNVWKDERGKQIELFAQSQSKIPSNITVDGFTLTENSSKLPFTSLFSYTVPEGETGPLLPRINLSEEISTNQYEGVLFYVEVPDFGTVSKADESVTTDQFYFGVDIIAYKNVDDGEGGTKKETVSAYKYTYRDLRVRGIDETDWSNKYLNNGGVCLPSGWKGYVVVPFAIMVDAGRVLTKDMFITGVELRQITNTVTDDMIVDANTAKYGYVPDDKPIVISEPVWLKMTGDVDTVYANTYYSCPDFTGTTGAYKDELTINGIEYNYNAGKSEADVIRPDASGLSTAMQNVYSSTGVNTTVSATAPDLQSGYGVRSSIASISPLTEAPGCSTASVRHYDNSNLKRAERQVATITFPAESALPAGGFLVYADIPELAGDTKFYTSMYNGRTFVGSIQYNELYGVKSFYVLRDGAEGWEEINFKNQRTYAVLSTADSTTGKSSFKGWIYLPSLIYRNNDSGIGAATFDALTFSIDPYRYSPSGHVPLENPVKFSGVTAIKAFDPTKNLVVGDNNKIVDLKTGEEISIDYSGVTKEFIGNKSLLPAFREGKDKVLSLNNLNLTKEIACSGTTPVKGQTIASCAFDTDLKNTRYVNTSCAISKMPAFNFNVAALSASRNMLQLNIGDAADTDTCVITDSVDGFMFYVKVNDENKTDKLSLNFQVYGKDADGGTINDIYGYSAQYQYLQKGETVWKTTTGGTPSGLSQLPAGFEGYVFFPKASRAWDVVGGKISTLYIYFGAEEASSEINFDFQIMTVAANSWTTENVGIAYACNNDVAQDMFTGDFRVVNDLDLDMNVDLVDLIRAKSEYASAQFTSFRKDYINDYMYTE